MLSVVYISILAMRWSVVLLTWLATYDLGVETFAWKEKASGCWRPPTFFPVPGKLVGEEAPSDHRGLSCWISVFLSAKVTLLTGSLLFVPTMTGEVFVSEMQETQLWVQQRDSCDRSRRSRHRLRGSPQHLWNWAA